MRKKDYWSWNVLKRWGSVYGRFNIQNHEKCRSRETMNGTFYCFRLPITAIYIYLYFHEKVLPLDEFSYASTIF